MARIAQTLGGVLSFLVFVTSSAQALGDEDTVLEARLAECAREQDGNCLVELTAFEEAAAVFEEASRRRPGELEYLGDGDLLLPAFGLRRALGQLERAYADAQELLRREPSSWILSELAEEVSRLSESFASAGDEAGAAAQYRAYLRDFGKRGGWDRFVIAHAKLGAALMRQSCPIDGYLGACVELTQERWLCPDERDAWGNTPFPRSRKTADEYWRETAKRHRRDPRLLREATKHLRMVVEPRSKFLAEEDAKASVERRRAWANAYSEATALLVSEDLDAFLGLGSVPENLHWDQPTQYDSACESERKRRAYEDSSRRWMRWLTEKVSKLTKLWAIYREAIMHGGPEASVAAAGRFALVTSRFEEAVWSAEPRNACYLDMHHRPRRDFNVLFENAAVAAQSCHELATAFGIDSDSATFCRLETERRWEMRFGWRSNALNLKHPQANPVDRIHEISPSKVFMAHVREDDDLAALEIRKLDKPARPPSKPRKMPCTERTAKPLGESGAGVLGILRGSEPDAGDITRAFGRVVPFPEDLPVDLAKRFSFFPIPPPQKRGGAGHEW